MVILVYNALGKMKSQGLKVTDLAANLTNIEQVVLSTAPTTSDSTASRSTRFPGSRSASQTRSRRRSTPGRRCRSSA